jgi:hypothetical protein
MRPAARPWSWTWGPGAGGRLRRLLRLGRGPVPLPGLGQVDGRGVPGLVVPLGGAWAGVPHGALEIAERPAGIEVQRRE